VTTGYSVLDLLVGYLAALADLERVGKEDAAVAISFIACVQFFSVILFFIPLCRRHKAYKVLLNIAGVLLLLWLAMDGVVNISGGMSSTLSMVPLWCMALFQVISLVFSLRRNSSVGVGVALLISLALPFFMLYLGAYFSDTLFRA